MLAMTSILCPHAPCVLGVLASWRETIESRHDGERHRLTDRGRRISDPHHARARITGIPGCGSVPEVYHAVLAYELAQRGLRTVSQQAIPVVYGTIRIDIGFRADLIVEDLVIVEIKSVEGFAPVHRKQLLTYLRLADKRLGLLINFNAALIKDGITRIVNGLEEESHAKPQGRQENH